MQSEIKPSMDEWLRERGVDDGTRAVLVTAFADMADMIESGVDKARAWDAVAKRSEHIASLRRELEEAKGYLIRNVLEPHKAEPLPTLMGICTQVDHLTATLGNGLSRAVPPTETGRSE